MCQNKMAPGIVMQHVMVGTPDCEAASVQDLSEATTNGVTHSFTYNCCRSTDPATYAPLNLATVSSLSLQMQFSDGSVRDFSSDSRAVFTVASVSSAPSCTVDWSGLGSSPLMHA